MKWPRVVASLLSVTTVSRCGAILHHDGLYGISTGFQHSDGLGGVFDVAASRERGSIGVGSARAGEGRAEALRRFAASRPMKTGTTIAGVVFEGGVVLGADTRATGGKTVCDRNCDKIHILASNMACCGAGTSADAVRVTEGVRLALLRMASEMQACLPSGGAPSPAADSEGGQKVTRDSGIAVVQRRYLRVAAAAFLLKRHLFRHQGVVSAALVLGGVDAVGEHLYQIHQGGSFAEVEFTAMGSGSLAALSVLEGGYREGLDEGDARELVLSAIAAGINNDLGSGSNIDVCVITSDRGLEHHRGVWKDPGLDGDESPANGQVTGEDVRAYDDSDSGTDESLWPQETPRGAGEGAQRARTSRTASGRSSFKSQTQPSPSSATDLGVPHQSDRPGSEIGGQGGSRAWVGSVRRRSRGKRVLRVSEDGVGVRSVWCSALDDTVELL